MARTTLKAHKYYDWFDIAKLFGFAQINDVFEPGIDFMTNGHLVHIYKGEYTDEELALEDKDFVKRYKNKQRIYNELGECEIYVWW